MQYSQEQQLQSTVTAKLAFACMYCLHPLAIDASHTLLLQASIIQSKYFKNALCACRTVLCVQARERSGPSGLHVGGQSPTSPKGWETMRLALIAGNVSNCWWCL